MDFSEYSKRIRPHLSGIHNHSHFVGGLFNAAGSTFFPVKGSYGADDNQRKLYSGNRKFNKNMKASFPHPIAADELAEFFDTRIGENSLSLIMDKFGMQSEEPQHKELFIAVLCTQFQNIVSEAADTVDDIVASEYKRLLSVSDIQYINKSPLYPGDDMVLLDEASAEPHYVNCYELFEHSWTIKNAGKMTWEGRCLKCLNHAETRIRAVIATIDIPKVQPGDEVTLTAQFDARGFEGTFESFWEVRDSDNRPCFPGKDKLLKAVATVKYERNSTAEVR
ncbi:MAG: hypothetical protein LBD02_00265 [Christensenellaceae bacterium]|nr:hypothetical protein [Christensenellaceae bacterium]